MIQVNTSDYHEIKFTRDTKVDYKNGDIITNTIFKKYDKDLSGDFNDEEWAMYEQTLKKEETRKQEVKDINTNVSQHYSKKIEKTAKDIEKLHKMYSDLDVSAWDRLLEFEKTHPQVRRCGYIDRKDIPSGAIKYDISAFQMGIYDEEKQSYTGECYKNGYLSGLDTLDKQERQEYLQLLKEVSKVCKKITKLDKKIDRLQNEFDKYKALEDMANSGMISKVGSKEYEEQAYQQYMQIQNEANPFYSEIKDLKQKIEVLRLKGNPTQADIAQLEQYNIQIQQLEVASYYWTIADVDNLQKADGGQGLMLTDWSEQLTYSASDKNELTNTHSAGAMYSNENFNIIGNISNSQKYTKPKIDAETETETEAINKFGNAFTGMLMGEYKRNDFSLSSNSIINTDNMFSYNQTLGFGYKNTKLEVGENITTLKMPMPNEQGELVETKNTTYTTNTQLSQTVGKFTNSVSARFAKYGNEYTISSDSQFNPKIGKHSSLSISPTLSASYNDKSNNYTLSPNLTCGYTYNNNDLNININANESFSTTMNPDTRPQINHNLTTKGTVKYKGFSTSLKFNNSNSSYCSSNTYGVSTSYKTKKAGTFGLEYSYQTTQYKIGEKNKENINLISFKYSLPLDWTRKKSK
ncbi:MAG: hypothetical protein MJ230_03530 [bacterium]|nr:hypothetical protein [bacterium]